MSIPATSCPRSWWETSGNALSGTYGSIIPLRSCRHCEISNPASREHAEDAIIGNYVEDAARKPTTITRICWQRTPPAFWSKRETESHDEFKFANDYANDAHRKIYERSAAIVNRGIK
jgi:hypothetical protein